MIELLDGDGTDHHTGLRARLAREAGESGLLDVAYRTIDTRLGPLLLAATSLGLVRVAFAVEGHEEVLTDLAARISPRLMHAPARLDGAAQQIDEYLHGDRQRFDLGLDFRLASGAFRHNVLAHLQTIAYGSTASYAAVALAAGSPKAVRAVGTACARNPLPVVVPCHRVVRSDGSSGQYVGGPTAKQTLLRLESSGVAAQATST
ncbi:methylated-DNA--[protein]-cysteine S-methyltransferase [Kineosporia succinea]|uniref:methylated-DNA--[protein]-cysteine S-methyltransferase n=1 Tax=Kineosporia succinea TaxID=84632 RepID=UPI0035213ADE